MGTEAAASGPVTGNAGATADGLDVAFDKAFDSIDLSDSKFALGVMDKTPEATTTTDEGKAEDAAQASDAEDQQSAEDGKTAAERARDEAGRFRKADAADKGKTPEKPSTAMSAPQHWDAHKREAFGKLTPEGQRIVLDLAKSQEAAFTKKTQELAEDRKFAEGVRSVIRDDHREQLRRAGMSEVDGIAHLIKLNDYATRDFPGYIRWAVAQAKLDPRAVFPQLAGQVQSEQVAQEGAPLTDPRFDKIIAALTPLVGKVQQIEKRYETEAEQKRSAAMNEAGQTIDRFRIEADEAGNLLYPHFDEVEGTIVDLIQSHPTIKSIPNMRDKLTKAYELAVYADPNLREQTFQAELGRRSAANQRQADVDKARRAVPAVRSTPTIPPAAKVASLDEAVNLAFRKVGG